MITQADILRKMTNEKRLEIAFGIFDSIFEVSHQNRAYKSLVAKKIKKGIPCYQYDEPRTYTAGYST